MDIWKKSFSPFAGLLRSGSMRNAVDAHSVESASAQPEETESVPKSADNEQESSVEPERTPSFKLSADCRSLAELREHFAEADVPALFISGELEQWLAEKYYEQQALAVRRLKETGLPESADSTKLPLRIAIELCRILGAACDETTIRLTPEQAADYRRRLSALREHTQNPEILSRVFETALDQEDLAALLRAGFPSIVLCGGVFSVPLHTGSVHYTGVGNPTMEASYTEEEYRQGEKR